jgi:tetratricopeptide (TPR) repeat protein
MLTPQVAVSDGGYKEQIGIGPFLLQRTDNKEPKGVYFEFTGVNAGFLAYGIASLTDGNGVIIMLNSGDDVNGLGKEVRRAVAKVYNWYNFLPEEITPLKLAEKNLDEYTGRYRRSADEVVYLRREKDYLVQNINEGTDIYCFPVGGDSVVFTDFGVRGGFQREKNGKVISLQTVWQDKPMPKLKDDELTPGELLRMGRYNEAKEGYRQMNLNEYGLTYLAYELLNRKPARSDAAKAILELAAEKYPTAAIVFSRWGDYYRKVNNRPAAIRNYQKALALDPTDQQSKEQLKELIR